MMSERRSSAPSLRRLASLLSALLLLGSAGAAVACPLCYDLARQLMTDGAQLDTADRVLLAVPGAVPGRYRIAAVVKGDDVVGDELAASVSGIDVPPEAGGDACLVVRGGNAEQWTSLGTIPVAYADWLRRLAATLLIEGERARAARPSSVRTTGTLSYSGWRQRIALVLPHLEDANPLAARIAWGEVSRAPYEVLDTARSRIDPARIAGWMENPDLSARRAPYTLLLGFVGGAADAAGLEQRLESAWRAHDVTDLAAMIAADLELHGPARVDWVESKYLADRRRTMPEIEAALLALDVHGDANRTISRERVIQAYGAFIKERPPMAGFVAPQLTDWEHWDEAAEYEALLDSGAIKDPASELAVVTYLNAARARAR